MRKAFTLIELLVVISIITILISMLLPALGSARKTAISSKCLSDKRQTAVALSSYATDNKSALPTRNPTAGYGYPHEMRRVSNGLYDLNQPFIIPYVGNRAFLFCPGLSTTTADLNDNWATSQYHVYPKNVFWIVPRPEIGKLEFIRGRAPLWSCFARIKGGLYTARGHENITAKPEGMITAFSDASAEWVPWKNTEGYWQSGEIHYWPIFRQ